MTEMVEQATRTYLAIMILKSNYTLSFLSNIVIFVCFFSVTWKCTTQISRCGTAVAAFLDSPTHLCQDYDS